MDPRSQQVADLGDALQRYQRSVQAFDDVVGRALRLGPADLRCLDWLVDGPKSAGRLSVATGLRPAATTALIDRLEGRGLVERVADTTDRRRVLVRMTEEGRERPTRCTGPSSRRGGASSTTSTTPSSRR